MAFKVEGPQFLTHTITGLPSTTPAGPTQSLQVVYRLVPDDEAGIDMTDEDARREFVKKVVQDLPDLASEEGKKIPFSEALLEQLIGPAYMQIAIAKGYGWAMAKSMAGN